MKNDPKGPLYQTPEYGPVFRAMAKLFGFPIPKD